VLSGPAMGRQILLEEGEKTLGRSPEADITLEDAAISRFHFKVIVYNNIATLEDLQSTNGTFVNGERIRRYDLRPNDKIQISSTTVLRFSYVDSIDTDVHKCFYEMAFFDAVTQAHSKRYFLDQLQYEFAYAQRPHNPLSL